MNIVSRLFLVATLGLALAGCTGMIRQVDQANIESVRKVVVVSQLGDTFIGSLTATTVFGNSSYKVDVGDWQVDEKLAASAVDAINHVGIECEIA